MARAADNRLCSPCRMIRENTIATRIVLIESNGSKYIHPVCDTCPAPAGTVLSDKPIPMS